MGSIRESLKAMGRGSDRHPAAPPLVARGDLTYLLGGALLALMNSLPASWQTRLINGLSKFLGPVLYRSNVARAVRSNTLTLFEAEQLPQGFDTHLRHVMTLTVWNSMMLNRLPHNSKDEIANLVHVKGLDHLDAYRRQGRAVLIWSYHFGIHPLIVAGVLWAKGYPIHVIAHAHSMTVASSLLHQRYLDQLKPITELFPVTDPREAPHRDLLDVLRGGGCLYVTPDYALPLDERSASPFEVPVSFLGHTVYLQSSSLRLAKRLDVPVVTILSRLNGAGKIELVVNSLELPTKGSRPGDLQADLQVGMDRLAEGVQTSPSLWWDLKREDLLERLNVPVDLPTT